MGSPIAAGSVVMARSSFSSFELVARRPLLGRCESATPPVGPGDPPTDVVVAWEDGTRVEYPSAQGLVSSTPPTTPSLLGTVVQFGGTLLPIPILEAGTRLRGPVVMQSQLFEANGDPLTGPDSEVVTMKTRFGYSSFLAAGFTAVPNA